MSGSGRSGTSEFQHNRLLVLAASDRCGICGHRGSRTVDHIIPLPRWPRRNGHLVPGFDGVRNLQPAHGSMGSNATRKEPHNRCPVCNRLCNQTKGDQRGAVRTTRNWYAST